MTHIALPTDETRRLSFYLAMEEYVASQKGDLEEAFFLWQVEPTVIFGRHQVIENEVNIPYCREHGIQFYRRKSGGGCVYADKSNVMMSYITHSDQVQATFREYMQLVCSMLHELGLEATSTENNDILIGGRKVSGNAFYHLPGRSIVHGTMLFDTDMQHMLQAITPPTQKLNKHGVESVRQRITLLKEHTNLSIEQFKQFAVRKLCNNELQLNAEDIKNIETIEKKYLNTEFIYGKENLSL